MESVELRCRFRDFALRLIPLSEALPKKKLSLFIEDQLLRSGFSAAANYRAACNAQSKKAFISKVSIALEEIDEAVFWLEMVRDANLLPGLKPEAIISEAVELSRILGASRRTAKQRLLIDN